MTAPAAKPSPVLAPQSQAPGVAMAAFSQLLRVEASARNAVNERELKYLMANDTLGLIRARQIFVMGLAPGKRTYDVHAVSSLAMVDRNVPLLRSIETIVAKLSKDAGVERHHVFMLPAYADPSDSSAAAYPFAHLLWVPLWPRDGRVTDGLLVSRDTAWFEADTKIALRLAGTYGHALALLRSPKPAFYRPWPRARFGLLGLCLLVFLGFVPVRMSALAPAEVVPRDAVVAAMPVDGIVDKVLVNPNDRVTAGQPLVRLVDIIPRNKFDVANREVAVANARLEQSSSLAFSDAQGRHDLGIAHAELALKIAERDFARDILSQSVIAAEADGIVMFSDKKDLEGRPLTTGDRLMQIAKPDHVELRIDLPVSESIVLDSKAPIRAFLDSDPLNAFEGEVTYIDYQAHLSDAQVAVHRVTAQFHGNGRLVAPLGTRGTAQIYGPRSTLVVYLFRKPLSALRQWIGQ